VNPIKASEFKERQRRAVEAARDRGLAALLVWSRMGTDMYWYGDVTYLTNLHCAVGDFQDDQHWFGHGYDPLILPVDGEPTVLTDLPVPEPDQIHVEDIRFTMRMPETVADVLREKGLDKEPIGLVGRQTLLASSRDLIEERLRHPLDLQQADDILERMRMIKSEGEIAVMRRSAEVGCECMNLMMEAVRPGVTEGEIVGEGLRHLVANGGYPCDVAITSGNRSDRYHHQAGPPHWDCERPLETGDMIHIDLWGPVGGYLTDFARSTVVGSKPTDEQREILEAPLKAIPELIASITPRTLSGEIFSVGERWMKDNGWLPKELDLAGAPPEAGPLLEHAPLFGHGIGMSVERPWFVSEGAIPVEKNMVLAVEFIISRDSQGAYLEHDVLVTDHGCEILDQGCPERWWD
jgi:Xaa-Pro dipeptidase